MAGAYPFPIVVPKGAIPFTPPTGQNPLRFTCCDGSIEVRFLPEGFTQAEFDAAAQSIVNAAAVKLAQCMATQYNQQHARQPKRCTITTASPLPSGDIGVPYSVTLTQTGATLPVTWSLASGALPPGLSLSSSGLLAGTPTGVGASYGFVVRLANTAGTSCTKLFTLTINDCASADWCSAPGSCRVRVKDFNQADWSLVWSGNLPTFGTPNPPLVPCGGFEDETGFVGLNYQPSGAAGWKFSVLNPDLTVYLADGPLGPSTTSPLGTYTKAIGSDPGGPLSFEIEAYTP